MNLNLPEQALVLLVGPSGSGKSTFARKHFQPTEILSSDFFRGMVCDDQGDQSVSGDAFELLHLALSKRLKRGRLTVIDATNLQPEPRKRILDIAVQFHTPVFAIVFDLPGKLCEEHNLSRPDRQVSNRVIESHLELLKLAREKLPQEGYSSILNLKSKEEVETLQIARARLSLDHRHEPGPFDIIGDVHGCHDELLQLLEKLGHRVLSNSKVELTAGRKLVFVGDLVDRGPKVAPVLRLTRDLIQEGKALCVLGNHDYKLYRKLNGKDVQISHGLGETLKQFEGESTEFLEEVRTFLGNLPFQLLLDQGKLVVAHAGMKAALQGRVSDRVRAFALYGETTGEVDEYGLPIRGNWWKDYEGKAFVVYGHTPVQNPAWINRCLCIDTGCVFGFSLTALRYPEMELVSVPAMKAYSETKRPLPLSFLETNLEAPTK